MKLFDLKKRHKIIITSAVLPLALLSVWFAPLSLYLTYKLFITIGLGILAFGLSLWSLWDGLNKLKAVILMILPTMFTLAVANYFFLLTTKWLAVPAMVVFAIIFYTLLLSQNVFNIASIRTIPLYRAASTAVFVLTMITAFLLFNVVYSMASSYQLIFIWIGVIIFVLCFLLTLPVLWSVEMEGVNNIILVHSVILSLIIAEFSIALSFWPVFKPMAASILMTSLFVILGTSTDSLRGRLKRGEVAEYVFWSSLVFLVAFVTTSWNG